VPKEECAAADGVETAGSLGLAVEDCFDVNDEGERTKLRAAIREVMEFVKLGPYPDTCVLGSPYCDCRKGQYCRHLPEGS
jgi:hypothetical protein